MREVKYRAWIKEKNLMVLLGDIHSIKGWEDQEWYLDSGTIEGLNIKMIGKDCDIMQSTGIKDVNGVEVFEGDIVAIPTSRIVKPLEVKFLDGAFCIGREDAGDNEMNSYSTIRDAMIEANEKNRNFVIAVIGNLFETPEVMKQEDILDSFLDSMNN